MAILDVQKHVTVVSNALVDCYLLSFDQALVPARDDHARVRAFWIQPLTLENCAE
jgi:hypothetical protein